MIAQISGSDLVHKQRNFFITGQTKNVNFRLQQLKTLKQAIKEYEEAILQALKADLHKPEFEAYETEIVMVFQEIDYAVKHLKTWAQPRKVPVPLLFSPGKARICPEPLGVVLIIGPWNYPLQLIVVPLIGAIAAGNCAILKPSELASQTSRILHEIITKYFPVEYIAVVEGGVETSQQLLTEKFDHIFFTGGTTVGKIVMEAAAKHLTPITLELGGKSPCIVDSDTDIQLAAQRIAWGKFLNAGQSCVAPDYLLVHRSIKQNLLAALQACVKKFYGDNPEISPDFGRIISRKHFERLVNLLKEGDIFFGGNTNPEELYIAPTVIESMTSTAVIMQEEIFGPILPVVEYTEISEVISLVNSQPKPLALYLFSHNKNTQQRILQETLSGGVGINCTVFHYSVLSLPFGGVGNSGIGRYHGKYSFDTFSHYKSVFYKPFFLDFKLIYPPYKDKLSLLKRLVKFL